MNLGRHVTNGEFDFSKLAKTVQTAVRFLDRVIDINFYPILQARESNSKWRPVGLGVMGLQDVFFPLRLPFQPLEARLLSRKIHEEIYYGALSAPSDPATEYGPHAAFAASRVAHGKAQFD